MIEYTGKIPGNRYEGLIRLTNIKQGVDNISFFGIIRIDRDEISRVIVVIGDLTITPLNLNDSNPEEVREFYRQKGSKYNFISK